MLDEGFSLITVGDSKRPNLKWKEQQTKQLSKEQFERNYNQESTEGVGYCTGFNNLEVFDIDLKILPTLKAQSDWWNEYHSFVRDICRAPAGALQISFTNVLKLVEIKKLQN